MEIVDSQIYAKTIIFFSLCVEFLVIYNLRSVRISCIASSNSSRLVVYDPALLVGCEVTASGEIPPVSVINYYCCTAII